MQVEIDGYGRRPGVTGMTFQQTERILFRVVMVSGAVHILVQHHPALDVIRWISLGVSCSAVLLMVALSILRWRR
jgi:hypothetical protein